MIKFSFFLLLSLLCLSACELKDIYSDEYDLAYRRPIALMMSNEFDSLQLTGKGIKIGVVDAGFKEFKTNPFTKSLEVIKYHDFIDGDTTGFFNEQEHDHGTKVAISIGGRVGNKVHGLAFEAKYLLAKTELANSEPREDEQRLMEAIEWLVSENVDIINLSIAYVNFDDGYSYSPEDLDGKTARSSKHIDSLLHANPKLVIVSSAGNRGDKDWQYIMFPADVKEVITVGSCDFYGKTRWKSSGVGWDGVTYIKPDVVTYPIPIGNSHTAPVIAGLCATLLQWQPKLDRFDIIDLLHQSGSNQSQPDRALGFGVPSTKKIYDLLISNNKSNNTNF